MMRMSKNGSEWFKVRLRYSFSKETILDGLRRSAKSNEDNLFCCERCGKTKKEVGYLEAHHKLSIYFAVNYFPNISADIIKSLANLEILCPCCHKLEHSELRLEEAKIIAQSLLGMVQLSFIE